MPHPDGKPQHFFKSPTEKSTHRKMKSMAKKTPPTWAELRKQNPKLKPDGKGNLSYK